MNDKISDLQHMLPSLRDLTYTWELSLDSSYNTNHIWDRDVGHKSLLSLTLDIRSTLYTVTFRMDDIARWRDPSDGKKARKGLRKHLQSIPTSRLPALASVRLWHPGDIVAVDSSLFKLLYDATAHLREKDIDVQL